jgi:hypothetical protein
MRFGNSIADAFFLRTARVEIVPRGRASCQSRWVLLLTDRGAKAQQL